MPFLIVPEKEFRPPLPKIPALPMFRVLLLRSSVPVRLTALPAARLNIPRLAAVSVPPRLSMPPAPMLSVPVLLRLVPVRVSVPPVLSMTPMLLQFVGVTESVPAAARKVPEIVTPGPGSRSTPLVNVVGLMVKVWPAVLAISVPALTMVATELSPIVPYPCSVMPLPMVSVWPIPP